MKVLFMLNLLFLISLDVQSDSDKQRPQSLIDWKNLDTDTWFSLSNWKTSIKVKGETPHYQQNLRDYYHKEVIGKFIKCFGNCKVFREASFFPPQYRSELREGDDLKTGKDSYAWIYLMDGTLVRIAPNSSLGLRDIMLSRKETYYYLRLNYGYIHVRTRETALHQLSNLSSTDKLFSLMPGISMKENLFYSNDKEEDNLVKYVEKPLVYQRMYQRLNTMINENNQKYQCEKDTRLFISFPNGSLNLANTNLDLVYFFNSHAYFRISQDPTLVPLQKRNFTNTYYYRGFENLSHRELESDTWFQVERKGKNLNKVNSQKVRELRMLTHFTLRPVEILITRELFIDQYSNRYLATRNLNEEDASKLGYKLWGSYLSKKSNLSQRIDFLVDYTRRVETALLHSIEKLEKTDSSSPQDDLLPYYQKALDRYLNVLSGKGTILHDRRFLLNSEKKYPQLLLNNISI